MASSDEQKRKIVDYIIEKNKKSQKWIDCYPKEMSNYVEVLPKALSELMHNMVGEGLLRGNGRGGYILSERLEFERLDKLAIDSLNPADADYLRKATVDAVRRIRSQGANLAGGDSVGYFLEGKNIVKVLVMTTDKPPQIIEAKLTSDVASLKYDQLVNFLFKYVVGGAGIRLRQ